MVFVPELSNVFRGFPPQQERTHHHHHEQCSTQDCSVLFQEVHQCQLSVFGGSGAKTNHPTPSGQVCKPAARIDVSSAGQPAPSGINPGQASNNR